ncbi:hypothetical protein FQA39_LY02343 [Lamprigera yunnana]|nr:hypothetical protein FQA39_LY02343 [Lamprigera yunnana]
MEFQFMVMFFAIVAMTAAKPSGVVPVAAPLAVAARLADVEFDPHPQYSFAYDVHDSLTGDFKSQSESRNGGLVQGRYTVADPDGTRRIVDYTADPVNGFNAVVNKVPQVVAAPLVAKAAPVIAAAPARVVAAAPAPFVAAAHAPVVPAAAPIVAPAKLAYAAAPLAYTAPAHFASVAYAAPAPIARVAYASPYAVY